MSAVDKFKQELDQRIAEWEALGVHISGDRMPRNLAKLAGLPITKHRTTLAEDRVINNMIGKLARERKRPYVNAFEHKHVVGPNNIKLRWSVGIPNTKRCDVLRAPFDMVASDGPGNMVGGAYEPTPIFCEGPRVRVTVIDNQGNLLAGGPQSEIVKRRSKRYTISDVRHFEHWLERCKTDDVFKRALGTLPAEVT